MTDKYSLDLHPFSMKDLISFSCTEPFDVWCVMENNLSLGNTSYMTMTNAYGIAIAICGIIFLRPGVAEVCVIRSSLIDKHAKDFSRMMRFLVNDYIPSECGLHRAEMFVDANWPSCHRWAEFLGFTKEGLTKHFTPDGRDHYCYARIYGS
jgi:hypothetical protein